MSMRLFKRMSMAIVPLYRIFYSLPKERFAETHDE